MDNAKKQQTKNNFLTWLKSFDHFGKPVGLTIDGEAEFKTLAGGSLTILLACYLIFILIRSFIPVFLNEIDTSQTQLINFDVDNEWFDPFEHGFTFAVGFPEPIDERVGTLTLSYETKDWIDDKEIRSSTPLNLHSCND